MKMINLIIKSSTIYKIWYKLVASLENKGIEISVSKVTNWLKQKITSKLIHLDMKTNKCTRLIHQEINLKTMWKYCC